MKIFDKDYKTNFVDDNNVVLGFDNSGQCCESFRHFFRKTAPTKEEEEGDSQEISDASLDLTGWNVDPAYFSTYQDTDGGATAVFRVVKENEEMFLAIYNHHNGYYGHGFTCTHNGTVIQDGSL